MLYLSFTFVSVGDFIEEVFHTLHHFGRIDDLGFVVKSANPCVKLLADFHMGGYNKMPFVIWTVENLFSVAETLHSGVQKVNAPNPSTGKKGNGTVKKGNDLRSGK